MHKLRSDSQRLLPGDQNVESIPEAGNYLAFLQKKQMYMNIAAG